MHPINFDDTVKGRLDDLNKINNELRETLRTMELELLSRRSALSLKDVKAFAAKKARQLGLLLPNYGDSISYLNWLDNAVWRLTPQDDDNEDD